MFKTRLIAVAILILGGLLGWFTYTAATTNEGVFAKFNFKLGLDLRGGTELVYKADTSGLEPEEVADRMEALRDVIELRVNLFGTQEPLVQVEEGSSLAGAEAEQRLIVQLPGVTDLKKAIEIIGETPLLEFKTEGTPEARASLDDKLKELSSRATLTPQDQIELGALMDEFWQDTGLSGQFLKRAELQFSQAGGGFGGLSEPVVVLEFDRQGTEIFARMTKENIGKTIGIFLDGRLISAPVVQEEITDGQAVITGRFTSLEAKKLVGRLNQGVLPLDVDLISSRNVGASLGADALNRGIRAGLFGFALVALFMILWYRLPGLTAVAVLSIYAVLMLAIFVFAGRFVTLTAAGLAGMILSVGMAVDANVLIFERLKEELAASNKAMEEAVRDGFSRAWPSIRDSNLSSLITAVVLYWFGTSIIEGFALIWGIGILVSMFTAIVATRTFLMALGFKDSPTIRVLFSSGFSK